MSDTIIEANGISITKNLIGINYTKGIFIKPKYIVVHDISNPKFTTLREYRNYIAREKEAKESVHYLVGARNIIKLLEDDWRGWHVGDKPSKEITNSNSISVAMFIREKNDVARTIKNVVTLVNKLRETYNIKVDNVVRHYDVTGKSCPEILLDETSWSRFKRALKGVEQDYKIVAKGKVMGVLSSLNLRKSPSDEAEVIGKIKAGNEFNIYEIRKHWVKTSIETDDNIVVGFLSKEYVEIEEGKEDPLNIIDEISEEEALQEISKFYKKTTYNPLEELEKLVQEKEVEVSIIDEKVEETKVVKVKVNEPKIDKSIVKNINKEGTVKNLETNLEVRRGAGEENFVIGYLLSQQKVKVLQQVGLWYKIEYQSTIGKRIGFVYMEHIAIS